MDPTQENRRIRLGGLKGKDTLVLSRFSGDEEISMPFEYEVIALSSDDGLELNDMLGEPITVSLETFTGTERYFNGRIVEAAYLGIKGNYAEYRLILRPWFWLLTHYSDCRVFQEMTAMDIIEKVFKDRGYSDFKKAFSLSLKKREYCVQYRESDFNFVCRLLEEEGLTYHFEHQKDKHLLVISDSSSRSPFKGYADVPFFDEAGDNKARKDHIGRWQLSRRVVTSSIEFDDFDYQTPGKKLNVKHAKLGPAAATGDQYDYPAQYLTTPDCAPYARARAEQITSEFEVGQGAGDCEGLCAGYTFKLTDLPASRSKDEREYLVVSTHYEIAMDAFRSGSEGEEDVRVEFRVADASVPYRSPYRAPRRRAEGLQTATVVGPKNEEIYTDKLGRIKIEFHWQQSRHQSKSDESSSCWVRVGQPWAGKGWGAMYIPRVGHEVIIDFLEGDPDKPIVVGSVYNGENAPPFKLPGEKTISGVKSRSSLKGGAANFNQFSMDDKKDSELVYLHAEKDLQQHVENDRTVTVEHDETVEIGNDDTWLVKGNRKVTVEKSLTTTVNGGETRKVTKDRDTDVKNNDKLKVAQDLTIEAGKQITIKTGASQIVMKASGQMEIKCVQLKISATKIEIAAAAQLKASGGAQAEVSSGGMTTIKAGGMVQVQGSLVKIN